MEKTLDDLRWGDLIDPQRPELGKYFPLHEHQEKILNSTTRFTAAVAGTGGGKTVTGPIWCIRQIDYSIMKYGKVLGMVIAPTYKVLSRATAPTLVETFANTQYEGIYKESKSYYELPNKWGKIWMQGADNPGGLEGGQFDFVWGDEGGQFRKKTFDAITGRTGAKMAPILITTTPYGLGPLYTEWYKRFLAGDKDYYFEHWASNTNPGYPDEEYERARRSMTPEKFKERYDGLFMRPEGLVYNNMHRCFVTMTKQQVSDLLKQPGKLIGGIDFGWNDPFCAIGGFLDSNDVLWIWFERYKSETIIDEHAKKLPKIPGRDMLWSADHVPGAIKTLKKYGHNVKRAKKHKRGNSRSPILFGILLVNARIHTGKLKVIVNRCPAIEAESELYRYKDKDEEILGDIPEDKDNHAMDALRYLITELDWKKGIG